MNLTLTQQAICSVIHENGGYPVLPEVNFDNLKKALSRCAKYHVCFYGEKGVAGIARIEVDEVCVTVEEYQAWAKSQS